MDKYLANLLPRLKRFSKDLNKKEVFVDKSWLLISSERATLEYVFMRDGQLLFSKNGKVQRGSWTPLANGKLLVDRITDEVLLENMFVDEAVMLLKVSGTRQKPMILVDEEKIPDLDVAAYLERKAAKKIEPHEETPAMKLDLDPDRLNGPLMLMAAIIVIVIYMMYVTSR